MRGYFCFCYICFTTSEGCTCLRLPILSDYSPFQSLYLCVQLEVYCFLLYFLGVSEFQIYHCSHLTENVSNIYLNILCLPLMYSIVWIYLGDVALLDKVCHWRCIWDFKSICYFIYFPLCACRSKYFLPSFGYPAH